jgi:hypothetical protein
VRHPPLNRKEQIRPSPPSCPGQNPVNEKQAKIDPCEKSARSNDVAMINNAPIHIDNDLRKTSRENLCANLMGGNRLSVDETRFGEDKGPEHE